MKYVEDDMANFSQYEKRNVHIDRINAGDTVIHREVIRKVYEDDIGFDPVLGRTIFNDSYAFGLRPAVLLVKGA